MNTVFTAFATILDNGRAVGNLLDETMVFPVAESLG